MDRGSQGSGDYSRSTSDKFASISTGISSSLNFISRRKGSTAPSNTPLQPGLAKANSAVAASVSPIERDSTEVDLERLGVRVERSYGVESM